MELTMTRDFQELEQKRQHAQAARMAHFRAIKECPVCQSGIKVRNIVETPYTVEITVGFDCGLGVKVGNYSINKYGSCEGPSDAALQKLEDSFYPNENA
jgi:hypothetical protein